jgi:hypothetical protein
LTPCGWSKEGLEVFNKLAKEIYSDRQDNDMEFDKAFKDGIEKEMASNNKNRKRKRNCIDTYNDLYKQDMINKDEEDSDEEENWVQKNVFTV